MNSQIVEPRFSKLLDAAFALFVLSVVLLPASIVGKSLQLLFVMLTVCIPLYARRRIPMPRYIVWSLVFVAFICLQVILGIAESSYTYRMIYTTLFTSLFLWGMFNYVVYRRNMQSVVIVYAKVSAIALILLMLIFYKSLYAFRFSADTPISMGGVNVGGISSTAIATCCAIPAFFISLFPHKGNIRKSYLYVFFFLLVSLLSGTRKTLLLFAYIIFFVLQRQRPNGRRYSLLKSVVVMAVGLLCIYLLVMNIPLLYNTVGYRLEVALLFFQYGDEGDSSIIARTRMVDEALLLFHQRPWLGWGMDYFKGSDQSGLGYYSHNNFLEILSGGGVLGIVIYYYKYFILLYGQIKAYSKQIDVQKRTIIISCIGFFLLMIILEYWQVTYFYRQIMIYQAIMLGVLYMYYDELQDKPTKL